MPLFRSSKPTPAQPADAPPEAESAAEAAAGADARPRSRPPCLRVGPDGPAVVARDGGRLVLPPLLVAAVDPQRPPTVDDFDLEVTGDDAEAAAAVARAYLDAAKFKSKPLAESVRVAPGGVDWPADRPLTGGFVVSVTVECTPLDDRGRPDDPALERAEVRLSFGAGVRPGATLEVRPRHLLHVYEVDTSGRGPTLTVALHPDPPEADVSGGRRTVRPDRGGTAGGGGTAGAFRRGMAKVLGGETADAPGAGVVFEEEGDGEMPDAPADVARPAEIPRLEVEAVDLEAVAAEWDCPGLGGAVTRMLRGLGPLRERTDGAWELSVVPRVDFGGGGAGRSAAVREQLVRRIEADPNRRLQVRCRVRAGGAVPHDLTLELHPKTNAHARVIGMDWGNSNSATVVQDTTVAHDAEIPREHFAALQSGLAALFSRRPAELDELESYWNQLLTRVADRCGLRDAADPLAALRDRARESTFSDTSSGRLYQLLHAVETELWQLIPDRGDARGAGRGRFQARVAARLDGLYRDVFARVPLGAWGIEHREDRLDERVVTSELELTDLKPLARGELGKEVRRRRLDYLAGEAVRPAGRIDGGRFIDWPKHYLPQIASDTPLTPHRTDGYAIADLTPVRGGRKGDERDPLTAADLTVTAATVTQAAVAGLIEPDRLGGALRARDRVVATYPADLRPEARDRFGQAIRELGVPDVHLAVDESIAPTVFHLEQIFGAAVEVGAEAFKVKCDALDGGATWVHNMLVLDIGGDTTDIAVIQLKMREVAPDASEFGGSLYQVTPRLLANAGRGHAGGRQLTLAVFRVLKQLLAGWLTESAGGPAAGGDGGDGGDGRPAADGPGDAAGPPEVVYSADKHHTGLRDALRFAETILPTHFHGDGAGDGTEAAAATHASGAAPRNDPDRIDPDRLRRFSALWEWAEALKLRVSELTEKLGDDGPPTVSVADLGGGHGGGGEVRAADLLDQIVDGLPRAAEFRAAAEGGGWPAFSAEQFGALVDECVDPSLKLAEGMRGAALSGTGGGAGGDSRTLHSIVLSGQACNLPHVRRKVADRFRNPDTRRRPPEIKFQTRYAKTATAIGALRAHQLMEYRLMSRGVPERLDGVSKLDLYLESLFFYLATEYCTIVGDSRGKVIFGRQARFHRFGDARGGAETGAVPAVAIRSVPPDIDPDTAAPDRLFAEEPGLLTIARFDGTGELVQVGRLPVSRLAEQALSPREMERAAAALGAAPQAVINKARVRFEIDFGRNISALLVRPLDHTAGKPRLRVLHTAGTPQASPDTVFPLDDGLGRVLAEHPGGTAPGDRRAVAEDDPGPPVHVHLGRSEKGRRALFADAARPWVPAALWEPTPGGGGEVANGTGGKVVRGWLSPTFEAGDAAGDRVRVTLSAAPGTAPGAGGEPGATQTLEFTPGEPGRGGGIEFPTVYRLLLVAGDDDAGGGGRVELVVGPEPAYHETDDVAAWLRAEPGCVLRRPLEPIGEVRDEWHNPRSGRN